MEHKNVLIIGSHALVEGIKTQYENDGCHVDCYAQWHDNLSVSKYEEFCILSEVKGSLTDADAETLLTLEKLAAGYASAETSLRPLCHVLLHSSTTKWLLQTQDIYEQLQKTFEVYIFTIEDQWSQNVFCHAACLSKSYPPLDREPIFRDSEKTIHLVIFGWSRMAESLVSHAALTAHYPNYVRNNTLRTRITIIDQDVRHHMKWLVQRNKSLFDNSYYRHIDSESGQQLLFHEPQYSSTRHDFVDVEWEFVDGDLYQPLIQQKLSMWAESNRQLLTIAFTHESCDRNFDEAFSCPTAVYNQAIPVFVYAKESGLLLQAQETKRFSQIYPIGMEDCGYDIHLPLLQMAKRLNYFYACSYGGHGTPTNMPADEVEEEWRKIQSLSIRYSNIYHVMTLATKMRSLGHDENDWGRFYALNQDEIKLLSAVEHNRWSVERMIMGFRPPTDMEREEIRHDLKLKKVFKQKRVHYDLCAYDELGEDETGQDVRIYDYDLTACIPLIAYSYNEDKIS